MEGKEDLKKHLKETLEFTGYREHEGMTSLLDDDATEVEKKRKDLIDSAEN
jgi:hypothetical protein